MRDGGAALHVPEPVIPGVADLAGEEADGIGLGLVQERKTAEGPERVDFDPFRSAQSPWASRPNTQLVALPAVADLTAEQTAGPSEQPSLGAAGTGRRSGGEIPAIVARGAAAVQTDVKTAPVVDRRDQRRRLGIDAAREDRRRCRAWKASNESNPAPMLLKTMHFQSQHMRKAAVRAFCHKIVCVATSVAAPQVDIFRDVLRKCLPLFAYSQTHRGAGAGDRAYVWSHVGRNVTKNVTVLTFVSFSVTAPPNLAHVGTTSGGIPERRSECGTRGRGSSPRSRAASGIVPPAP